VLELNKNLEFALQYQCGNQNLESHQSHDKLAPSVQDQSNDSQREKLLVYFPFVEEQEMLEEGVHREGRFETPVGMRGGLEFSSIGAAGTGVCSL
jgi:hypothetical protein